MNFPVQLKEFALYNSTCAVSASPILINCIICLVLQVTLVGMIRSVNEAATRLDYELDDNTGPFLDVRQFVDNDVSLCIGDWLSRARCRYLVARIKCLMPS